MNRLLRTWLLLFVTILLIVAIIYRVGATPSHSLPMDGPAVHLSPPTPAPLRPGFEKGMLFPQWGTDAYGPQDKNYAVGLSEIVQQTAADWLGMTITFHQASEFTTHLYPGKDTPTTASLAAGIQAAHAHGFHAFLSPLITLDGMHSWEGYIAYSTGADQQAWFASYWQMLEPYVQIAQQNHAEQLSIGNELDRLQLTAPILWHHLIQQVHSVYSGRIVYGMNWATLTDPLPSWMQDPLLYAIGISQYLPLTDTPIRLDAQTALQRWRERVQPKLDLVAKESRHPVFLSEIGYQDTAYAGYNPWQGAQMAPRDDGEQALLYENAIKASASDHHVVGLFFWAWSVPLYAPNWKPAAQILRQWYIKL